MATRLTPLRALMRFRATRKKSLKIAKSARTDVPDYVSESVLPEVAIEKPCTRKKPKGIAAADWKKTLRACHTELLLVGDIIAKERGVEPGPHLQLCADFGKPGVLVPVKDHVDAHRVSKAYCECRATKDIPTCVAEVGGLGGPFGAIGANRGYGKRRTR